MFSLNYGDRRPLYQQITERFKELVLTGAMKEGDKIPSVRELAATLAINPNTIQRAYRELENQGYILSVPAKGSFVAPVKAANLPRLEELRRKLRELLRELRYTGETKENILGELEAIYSEEVTK